MDTRRRVVRPGSPVPVDPDASYQASTHRWYAAAGLSVQQYLRSELTRIAGRPSPAEFIAGREPMSRAEFEAIRERLRATDAA